MFLNIFLQFYFIFSEKNQVFLLDVSKFDRFDFEKKSDSEQVCFCLGGAEVIIN